jgi:hypothetical protein
MLTTVWAASASIGLFPIAGAHGGGRSRVVVMSGPFLILAVAISAATFSAGRWLIGPDNPSLGLTLVTVSALLLFVALLVYVIQTAAGIFVNARGRDEK